MGARHICIVLRGRQITLIYLRVFSITVVDLGGFFADPFTIRTLISLSGGVVTALVVVRLTF